MSNHSPITPPPELVEQWRTKPEFAEPGLTSVVSMTQSRLQDIATQAAQWGADQELEACCQEVDGTSHSFDGPMLHAARRPKPPSLKEQALNDLDTIQTHDSFGFQIIDLSTIRRALEALDD